MSHHYSGHARPRRQVLKVILLGDSSVGKTSLMRQYVTHRFETRFKATIGADFYTKELEIDNQPVTLHIWDTAGQERFQSLGTAFYRGADVCVLVFDITNAQSFTNLKSWMDEFRFQAGKEKKIIVVGNKADLKETKQEVYGMAVKEFCASVVAENSEPLKYVETSAKTNAAVEDLFLGAAEAAYRQKQREMKSVEAEAGVVPGSVTLRKTRGASMRNQNDRSANQESNEKKKCSC